MSEIPEVFAIFEQKLAHVLSFTVVPLKSKDLKNALEEILTYFSGIVERASKAESRIAELEAAQRWHVVNDGDLPIVGKSIMFYDSSSEEIYRGVYTASHRWRANYFSEKCGTVTHWMPLPQPPEVQS